MFILTPYVYEVIGRLWFGFPRIITTEKYSAFIISGGKRGKYWESSSTIYGEAKLLLC
jgi:hypothetical protein